MPLRFAFEPPNGSKLVQDGLNQPSVRKGPLSGRAVDFDALPFMICAPTKSPVGRAWVPRIPPASDISSMPPAGLLRRRRFTRTRRGRRRCWRT